MKRLLAIFMTLCMVMGLSGVNVWATEGATWQAETPIPTGRAYAFSCAVGNNIYVMGGSAGITSSPTLDSVEIYNTKTKTWTKGQPIPEQKRSFTASVVGDKIYAFGGQIDGSQPRTLDSVLIYDTKNDKWTTGQPMKNKKAELSSVAIGSKIYVMGGRGAYNYADMDIYDTETDTWSTGTAMPTVRSRFASAAIGGKIYVIGGFDNASSLKSMDIYDTQTKKWSEGVPMPNQNYYFVCEAVGDDIYVLGNGDSSPDVLIYSSTKMTWEKGPNLTQSRFLPSSALVNGTIYIIGGSSEKAKNTMESLKVSEPVINKPLLSILLNTDETVQLSVSYNLADNTGLTWSSTNEAVATVDKSGKVTAVGEGQADIYAQNADGTFKEYISVKVVPGTANGMRLAAHLKVGEKVKLHLFDDPSKVTWKSMDESIATVSTTGQVTAAKKGLAIIQGELEGQTYQIYVRVNG